MTGGAAATDRPRAATLAACAAVVLAPLVPGVVHTGTNAAILAVPFEAVALVLLLVVVPWRAARVAVATAFALLVVAATVLAGLDRAFVSTIDRPFRAADDAPQLLAAAGVVRDAAGDAGLVAALVALVAVTVGAVWALAAAALRVGRVAAREGATGRTTRIAAALAAGVWIVGAALGAQLVPGIPLAAADSTGAIAASTAQAATGLRDRAAFARALKSDTLRDAPPDDLFSALAGKDVVIAFVESYGRVAVERSALSTGVDRLLREGGTRLEREGYFAQSAFLTSSTFGGVSWLAHATLQSGVWTDSQQKYDALTASDRMTLSRAFGDEGWQTLGIVPSNDRAWPVGASFYGYDDVLDSRTLGYRGPSFSYARVPDQFTWARFDREVAATDAPLFAEIDLVSSHTPWTPLPRLVPWSALGDGSVFDPQPAQGEAPVVVWQDADRVRDLYGQSIEYSLGATISYLETHDRPDLVVVLLGDHQPSRIVSGTGASHDVPVTIIAKDPEVMARIASWGWDAGLLPSPDAPVWRMDAFRDRFVAAFSGGTAGGSGAAPGAALSPDAPR